MLRRLIGGTTIYGLLLVRMLWRLKGEVVIRRGLTFGLKSAWIELMCEVLSVVFPI